MTSIILLHRMQILMLYTEWQTSGWGHIPQVKHRFHSFDKYCKMTVFQGVTSHTWTLVMTLIKRLVETIRVHIFCMEKIHLDKCFFFFFFNTVRHMQSLSYMIYTQVVFFILTMSAFTSFLISLFLCLLHIDFLHGSFFSNTHLYRSAESWQELFVQDSFHPYMAASLPGSTRNSSDSDINTDYPVSMEMNEQELTDGLRRAKRQVRVFSFDISWSVIYFFSWRLVMHNRLPKGHLEICFNQRRTMVKLCTGPKNS